MKSSPASNCRVLLWSEEKHIKFLCLTLTKKYAMEYAKALKAPMKAFLDLK